MSSFLPWPDTPYAARRPRARKGPIDVESDAVRAAFLSVVNQRSDGPPRRPRWASPRDPCVGVGLQSVKIDSNDDHRNRGPEVHVGGPGDV